MAADKKSDDVEHSGTRPVDIQVGSHEAADGIDKPLASCGERDDALDLFDGDLDGFSYSAKEANWVRWKLDMVMLPLMTITYVLNYMDKVALSEASIFGIQDDLKLVGQQYSWSSSVFYLGYLVWQYPSSILMQKLPIGRYFGIMIILWGVTATTTVVTTNFTTLAINRVFLGIFETCMSPILTILIGQYWTRNEQPFRTSIWWAGSATGAFIADAITYAVSGRPLEDGKYSTWQIIYLIFGPVTMVWGVIVFFGVPSSPMTAWFLSKREKKIAVMRVISNQTGVENRQYKWHQVRECLMDPQPWMLAALAFLQSIQGGGLSAFGKLVLTGMGYTGRQATLMAMPSHTIHLVSIIFAGWFCSRFRNTRCIVMFISNLIVLVGSVLVNQMPNNPPARLGGFYMIYVNTLTFFLSMSMISSNIAGFTKKATASVLFFIGYCVGQFSGPQFWISSESPLYPTGFRSLFSSVAIMLTIQIALPTYLIFQNRRRDRAAVETPGDHDLLSDLLDLTDKEQPEFRYVWYESYSK